MGSNAFPADCGYSELGDPSTMGWLRRTLLVPASELAWRLPGRPARLLSEFSLAERGSMLDMLAAVERTPRREMRRKYFLHALDEWRHYGIFAGRAKALDNPEKQSRSVAAIDDAGALQSRGVQGEDTLFDRMGEFEFLAFVYVAEADAVEQFQVYIQRKLPDAATLAALKDILKDEAFHVSYSRAECDKYRKEGRAIDKAISMVRWRRLSEGWLRFSKDIGDVMSGLWLLVLYAAAVGPFRALARLESGGWQAKTQGLAATKAPPLGPAERLAAARHEA